MKIIWLGFIIEIFILSLFKSFFVDFKDTDIYAVSFHMFFTMIVLMSFKHKHKAIFIGAFLMRVIFLIWDVYARNIFVLPNSGSDSEMYYNQAIMVSENLWWLNQSIRGGLYSKINGLIFYLIGPQRMVGQYINVLLGLSTVYIIYRILLLLKINSLTIKKIFVLTAFFPQSLIMSSIFLREMMPTFFVALSIFYFVKWFETANFVDLLLSFVMVGVASVFHCGVIGIFIGYAFGFLFFQRDKNQYRFTPKTILAFVLLLIIVSIGITTFGDYIFGKFRNIDNIEAIYLEANYRSGGSAYLKGLTISNPFELIIFGPIKSFYFIASPLPMNWRGGIDVFTFLTDSVLYFGAFIYLIKNRKVLGNRKTLVIAIAVMILGAILIFGVGVSNAGTAMRHRQKLAPLFLLLLAVISDGKHEFMRIGNSLKQKSVL